MIKLILFSVLFFIVSCSSNDGDELVNDQSFYDNNIYQDYHLYEKAEEYILEEQFDLALAQLDKIEVIFPSSEYASKSMLLRAYIHFLINDYEKTRAIAESYKNFYPGSNDIIYANYLDAMTYYLSLIHI